MGQKTACITLFITYNVSQQIIENSSTMGQGPIIAKLHVTHECTRILGPFFADGNNK
jgi:hypothetical protein